MKVRKLFLSIAATIILIGSLSLDFSTKAGIFGRQGHWVQRGDTTLEECMKHWWHNDCKVGDEQKSKNAPRIQVE